MIAVRQYASHGFFKAGSPNSRGQKIVRKALQWPAVRTKTPSSSTATLQTSHQERGPRRSKTFVHLQGGKGTKSKSKRRAVCPVSNDERSSAPNTIRLPLPLFVVIHTPMMDRPKGASAPAIRLFGFRITLTSPLGAANPVWSL